MEVDWAGTTGHCFYSCMVLKYEVVDSRLRVAVAEGFADKMRMQRKVVKSKATCSFGSLAQNRLRRRSLRGVFGATHSSLKSSPVLACRKMTVAASAASISA